MSQTLVRRLLLMFATLVSCGASLDLATGAEPPNFSRDILSILSDNCFHCHGPDAKAREADLRLDVAESALRTEKPIIVPGKSTESEVFKRIVSTDPDVVMPPLKSGRKLTAAQIVSLKQWIDSGAKWGKHWAFEKPIRPAVPEIRNPKPDIRNPIDAFILARLEREGLQPSPEAAKETLVRRVTLDLTGLPPTLEEVDAFLADQSPEAYIKVVDRLLKSPRFGERMVWEWLDAARYADTNGYQGDPTRTMYFWRDWVIDALNNNMPFDQFTVEQLAGDLLPNPTQSQLVATGFHRNHMINGEGGRIAEESRVDYVQDRVETTGTVWMGLTFNCCRCHDHKFDPLTQREYYQLSAYFNSIDESGANDAGGLANPIISLATPEGQQKIAEMKALEDAANKERADVEKQVRGSYAEWEKQLRESLSSTGEPTWTVLVPETAASEKGATLTQTDDGAILASGQNPATDVFTIRLKTKLANITGIRLEALPDDSLINNGPGRADNGNFVLTEFKLQATGKPVELGGLRATFEQGGFPIANAVDNKNDTGWAIASDFGKAQIALFDVKAPLNTVAESLRDSESRLGETRLREASLTCRLEFLSPHVSHVIGKFRISVTNSPAVSLRGLSDKIREILVLETDKRSDAQKKELADFQLNNDVAVANARRKADDARKAREGVERSQPRTMVMRERTQLRDTFILIRGAYDKFGDKVAHGVPSILPPLPVDSPANRLALARWLVSPDHPLTARVIVNRYWQTFFGTGLVKTAEDFGVQGEKPSHPELLDWLASEFVAPTVSQPSVVNSHPQNAWNVKHLLRLLVTSATYRQSSRHAPRDEPSHVRLGPAARRSESTQPDAGQRREEPSEVERTRLISRSEMATLDDPDNRLLARSPRYRLPSWMIRDQALAICGLLVEKQGGPPVKGYQPPGIWEEATFGKIGYQQDTGEALYRRSLYQFWRRIVGPTIFFDVAARQTCQVKVARTNTPLHALATLNDITYVEAARALAQRVLLGPASDDASRLTEAFRRCTSRRPNDAELAVLMKRLQLLRETFSKDEDAAKKLISVGGSKPNDKLNADDLAAYTGVATLLLNLDETISKE
jgi:uncharacterized protein DUF1549/uncharacterized protein DUF1553/cytochrome c